MLPYFETVGRCGRLAAPYLPDVRTMRWDQTLLRPTLAIILYTQNLYAIYAYLRTEIMRVI